MAADIKKVKRPKGLLHIKKCKPLKAAATYHENRISNQKRERYRKIKRAKHRKETRTKEEIHIAMYKRLDRLRRYFSSRSATSGGIRVRKVFQRGVFVNVYETRGRRI